MKHIVGFSGGIDSQAAALWVRNRYPPEDVIITNSPAGGNEHPITTEFVSWYGEKVHEVIGIPALVSDMWATPGFAEKRGFDGTEILDFPTMASIKGRFPSKQAQFCTEYLKLIPQKRWITGAFGVGGRYEGESYVRYTGVRRDESTARKATVFERWDDWFDCQLFAPVFDFSKQMCFDYVASHAEKVNELYSLGFERVGCAPCVNSGKDDIANWALRSPDMIDKVEEWERRTGRTFFYAIRIPGMPSRVPVRQVVEWSKTKRGGRQDFFPILHEREACESKYGLCE